MRKEYDFSDAKPVTEVSWFRELKNDIAFLDGKIDNLLGKVMELEEKINENRY